MFIPLIIILYKNYYYTMQHCSAVYPKAEIYYSECLPEKVKEAGINAKIKCMNSLVKKGLENKFKCIIQDKFCEDNRGKLYENEIHITNRGTSILV